MCGICGWYKNGKSESEGNPLLRRMTDSMRHRGPDGEGFFTGNGVALGHRRLSIIDRENGKQPMKDDKNRVIVFDGEIYNFQELRDHLQSAGMSFSTKSDTEVLLKAYAVWGQGCLEKFIGPFSFVIYDPDKKELFIARDRLGKKPLYYYKSDSLFVFASEIKAILQIPEIRHSADIDPYSLSDYLSLGYILTPKTIFKNIKSIPAGFCGTYDINLNRFSMRKYWSLEDVYLSAKDKGPRRNFENEFLEKFNNAVKLRMYSEVPRGAFLSGGIDSSSVAAFMRKNTSAPINTFSIGFSDKSYDESEYAEGAAAHLGTNHKVSTFYGPDSSLLSKMVWHFDQPFADTSSMPMYQLSKVAKDYISVAFSGDGADEVMAGYPTYAADRIFGLYSKVPVVLQKSLYQVMRKIMTPTYERLSWDYKLTRFLGGYGLSRENAHYWWRVIFSENEKKSIMSENLIKKCGDYNPYDTFRGYFERVPKADFLNKSQFVDIKTWLQDDILVKVDRMSLANSVEVRSPFLDHRLVEFAARLPSSLKVRQFCQKRLLKYSMAEYLPPDIVKRQKQGFNAPSTGECVFDFQEKELFAETYRLDPEREDITFKSFNLSVLQKWLDIYRKYKKTGEWEAVTYNG
ncbi:asparagine synthase (glutamine-hydrolyzing) [Candidatus Omnitrophota bacterium]